MCDCVYMYIPLYCVNTKQYTYIGIFHVQKHALYTYTAHTLDISYIYFMCDRLYLFIH